MILFSSGEVVGICLDYFHSDQTFTSKKESEKCSDYNTMENDQQCFV